MFADQVQGSLLHAFLVRNLIAVVSCLAVKDTWHIINSHAVYISLVSGIQLCMKTVIDFLYICNRDIHWKIAVQIMFDILYIHRALSLEVDNLCIGVHTNFCTASTVEIHNKFTGHLPQNFLNLIENCIARFILAKSCPTLITAAIVFYRKFYISHV